MKRLWTVSVVAGLLLLSGCSSEPEVDPNVTIIPEVREETSVEVDSDLEAELNVTLEEMDEMETEMDSITFEEESSVETQTDTTY